MRPDWDSYFLRIAREVASRSTCDRAFVGCVLTRDNRILTTGYNGSPSGLSHCSEIGHLMIGEHCRRTIHAEINAIIQAALLGIVIDGATCYLTHSPCFECSKVLINAGVKRIVYENEYRDDYVLLFLYLAGIEIFQGAIS